MHPDTVVLVWVF